MRRKNYVTEKFHRHRGESNSRVPYYRGIKFNGKLKLTRCVCLVTYRVKIGFSVAECAVVFVNRTDLENRM